MFAELINWIVSCRRNVTFLQTLLNGVVWWLYVYRYQKKCDQLEVSNGEFRDKFEQLEENKKDIVAFIKKKLDEKGLYL